MSFRKLYRMLIMFINSFVIFKSRKEGRNLSFIHLKEETPHLKSIYTIFLQKLCRKITEMNYNDNIFFCGIIISERHLC